MKSVVVNYDTSSSHKCHMHDVVLIAVSAAVIIDDRMFSIILQISLFFIFQLCL